jgi:hypothetical protein
MMWKRHPEGGLYDFDLNGWWVRQALPEFGEILVTDRTFGGVFLGEVD